MSIYMCFSFWHIYLCVYIKPQAKMSPGICWQVEKTKTLQKTVDDEAEQRPADLHVDTILCQQEHGNVIQKFEANRRHKKDKQKGKAVSGSCFNTLLMIVFTFFQIMSY